MRRALLSIVAVSALTASLVVTAPPAPAAASTGTEIADCLVRSAIVPVEASAEAAEDELREAAARTLQHTLLEQHPDSFAGVELTRDADGAATGLRMLGVAGATDAAALVPDAIAGLDARLQAPARSLEVVVAGRAEVTMAALCAAQASVMQLDGDAGDAIISVAIDPATASLRVGLDTASPAPRLAGMIDALPSAVDGEQPTAAPAVEVELGLEALGVPIEMVADAVDRPTSRMHDSDGYGGGNAIRVTGLACTTGFAIRTADRAPAVLTAGHCPSPVGSDGGSVVSGHAAALCGLGSGSAIGRGSQNLLSTGQHVDSMVVRTAAARPTMWLGAACTGSLEVAVHGMSQAGTATSVGFSGARQGEQYATRTSESAGCYDFGFWACSTYRATSPRSTYACLPGDSGGPAFRHRSGGGVFALGIISASGYDLGINRCSWVDMATALHLSGATIMTHASLSMAPPSRIAGGDRYQTAAMVSQRGYPNGAGEVYVASGVLFPDALSAGAAAAHVRVPLLLTAAAQLPGSTRTELARLAPSRIVLVGGTPSVSAAVEAELARIAPVVRIAGDDRYQTSALVARHAFPTGAASAFLATGLGFPDALAAGPVAARRAAPILLVPGSGSASQHTIDALDDLGTTRLTVVGGTPSVSSAVVASVADGRAATRVAGADRYETAVLLNAAFGARPPAMLIAAGSTFPDALAASAVAGARGEPLYLTPSTCLSSLVPGEHARLGAPPVVLLGGTPTLSLDVTRYELCG